MSTMFIMGPRITIVPSEVVVRPIDSTPDRNDILRKGEPHILLKLGIASYQKESFLTMSAAATLRDKLVEQLGPPGSCPQ